MAVVSLEPVIGAFFCLLREIGQRARAYLVGQFHCTISRGVFGKARMRMRIRLVRGGRPLIRT